MEFVALEVFDFFYGNNLESNSIKEQDFLFMVVGPRVNEVGFDILIEFDLDENFGVTSFLVLPGERHRNSFVKRARRETVEADVFFLFFEFLLVPVGPRTLDHLFEFFDLFFGHASATP